MQQLMLVWLCLNKKILFAVRICEEENLLLRIKWAICASF